MSASNAFESDALKLIFQNINIANLGDATGVRGSTTAGSLYVALHSADPGEAGDQTTNEISYTGYARVAVARSSGAWTLSGTAPTQVANAAQVAFGQRTDVGSVTATHFSVGYLASGAGVIADSGALNASLIITQNITPAFEIGTLVINLD